MRYVILFSVVVVVIGCAAPTEPTPTTKRQGPNLVTQQDQVTNSVQACRINALSQIVCTSVRSH
jgi:hypothetical protein